MKNSSTWIPGHGGLFDRFDSFILSAFTLPFFGILRRILRSLLPISILIKEYLGGLIFPWIRQSMYFFHQS